MIYSSYYDLFNIGDYIQSLAARQFLTKPYIYINRERLDSYNGEQVKMIMNGWFLHEPEHWPPTRQITPLYISFHLNSIAYKILEDENCLNYFKEHEPIGCRDYLTSELLQSKGIDAYFTGCLTLTLGESFKSEIKSDDVLFVDPYYEVDQDTLSTIRYLLYFLRHLKTIISVKRKMLPGRSIFNVLRTTCFYSQYIKVFDKTTLLNATYFTHKLKDSEFRSEDEKFAYAEYLISKYAKARFVVTTRLHCALPCLGLGTPVIYIENKNQPETSFCRFKGIRDYLNIVTYSKGKFTSSDIDLSNLNFSAIRNKAGHIKAKDDLVRKCKEFMHKLS